MANLTNITFDCEDAPRLATFWAAALDGYSTDETGIVVKPHESGPTLYFQVVPGGKTAKNRVHLDVNVGKDAMHAKRFGSRSPSPRGNGRGRLPVDRDAGPRGQRILRLAGLKPPGHQV